MSAWKQRRDIIAGFLIVGAILALWVVQVARFADRYLELVNTGFYIGLAIFVLGLVLVVAYVVYYD